MSSKTIVSAVLIGTIVGAASTVAGAQTTDDANVQLYLTLFPFFPFPFCGIGFAMFAPLTLVGLVGMRRRNRRRRSAR
ncbi:MAG: hypothetical protein V3T70_04885 [Phycisphaerae bacterium]